MRFRIPLFTLVFTLVSFAIPYAAQAALGTTFPFFGPIVPSGSTAVCSAGWGLIIVVINNIISLLITLAVVFVAPLMIAYSGFLLVMNSVDPSGISKAKEILQNTIVGLVVALAAWIIVDALMAVLYNGMNLGAWNQIINWGGDPCLSQAGTLPTDTLNQAQVASIAPSGVQYFVPVSGNCTPASLVSYGIDPAISTTMSCIAQKESSCNLVANNPGSSAFGLFQVVNGYNDTGHNLNFPACTAAAQQAQYTVSGDLNCHNAVLPGGAPNPSQITLYNACRAASANPTCNAQAAQWLYTNKGGFNNWAVHASCGV